MDDAVTRSDQELELGPERSVHNHPLDPISLAFGVIFTIVGAAFLFGDIEAASLSIAWAWAGLFGTIGLLLLAIGIRRQRTNASHPDSQSERKMIL